MKKINFIVLVVGVPLALIFMAFFNPEYEYAGLVRMSILIFVVLSIPYCLLVKDPRYGLILFMLQTSLLEGPWKIFTYGTGLKMVVYTIRDALLYSTFFNFVFNKKRILSEEVLRQRPPYTGIIALFLVNIVIQIFNPAGYNYLNSVVGSRIFWEMIPLYWMGFYLMRNKENFKVFCWVVLICMFLNAIATIIQFNWGKERVAAISQGYSVLIFQWGRVVAGVLRPPGLGSDMGFAGYYFSQAVIIITTLFFIKSYADPTKKILYFIVLSAFTIVGLTGLITSTSRSAIVTAVNSLIVVLILQRKSVRNRTLKVVILFSLIGFLVIPYITRIFHDATAKYGTIESPKALMDTILKNESFRGRQAFITPFYYSKKYFFGNGLGKVGPGGRLFAKSAPSSNTNSENTINLAITEIGTIGTLLLLLFHLAIVKRGHGFFKHINDYEWKWYATISFGYILLLLLYWQFGQLIAFPQNAGFWFLSGVLMSMRYVHETK